MFVSMFVSAFFRRWRLRRALGGALHSMSSEIVWKASNHSLCVKYRASRQHEFSKRGVPSPESTCSFGISRQRLPILTERHGRIQTEFVRVQHGLRITPV
jgi:hypothetical protein